MQILFMTLSMMTAIFLILLVLVQRGRGGGLQECLTNPLSKFVMWAIISGLIYHSVAGIKHLVMDMGIGETMEGGVRGVQIVIVVSVVLIAYAGFWIW